MEGSSRGGAVVLTHISAEDLSVIPFVLESGDREELQFSKEKWETQIVGSCELCHTTLAPWLCWLSPALGELCAQPLGCVRAALCLSWSMGWEQEQQGVFDVGSVQVITPKPQSRALSLKALGLSLCWWPLPGLELL